MILGLPPAEIAVHPGPENFAQRHAGHELMGAVLYLMCDDVRGTIRELAAARREHVGGRDRVVGHPDDRAAAEWR